MPVPVTRCTRTVAPRGGDTAPGRRRPLRDDEVGHGLGLRRLAGPAQPLEGGDPVDAVGVVARTAVEREPLGEQLDLGGRRRDEGGRAGRPPRIGPEIPHVHHL
ncbi:hypothetical protein [Nocardioides halotolerans]|uniref:hypothetical protein n=1 Tax=Nocardioides halotolerans TaxID=433660 RepID=UPI001B7FCD58|nr:hypothetical protein [Nocardioides halotolerans]